MQKSKGRYIIKKSAGNGIILGGEMTNKRNFKLITASFFLPLLIMCAAFAALGITPFGDKTLLFGDANYYFINYLSYFRSVLEGEHSLFYSFSNGIGGNISFFTGLYLFRPDIIFYELAGWDYMPEAYSASVFLSTSLCGLTMYLLLANIHGDKISNLIFSTSYALMAFNVVYNYAIIFHSGPVMLPLMVLGLKKLIEGKSALLYELSIAYTLLNYFQMGYILCFTSVLFFCAAMIMLQNELENRRKIVLRYFIASLLAGGISSFGWIPAFLSASEKAAENDISNYAFIDNGPILQMAARLFSGASSNSQIVDGYPLIFCGILTVALVILFFMNSKISVRVKRGIGSLLAIFIISFYIQTFEVAFQGFTNTAWFNFRQSFVFSFILLLVAAKEFECIDEIGENEAKKVFWILLISALVIFSIDYEFIDGGMVVADFIILMIMGLCFLFYKRFPERADKRSLVLLCLLCVCFQMYLNYYFSETAIMKSWHKSEKDIQDEILERQPLIYALQAMDNEFYRMENEDPRTGIYGNDPFMFHYNGVGHTSYTPLEVNKGLSKLGISWMGIKSNSYDRGIPAAIDSFLGIRYVLSKQDLHEQKGYEQILNFLGVGLYKNPYVLPIAILSNNEVIDVNVEEEKNIFKIQNDLWKSMTGDERDIFIPVDDYTVSTHNVYDSVTSTSDEVRKNITTSSSEDNGDVSQSQENEKKEYDTAGNQIFRNKSYIEISFVSSQNGPVYMYDSAGIDENSGTSEDVLKYLGTYKAGDKVIGRIYLDYEIDQMVLEQTVEGLYICYENRDVLKEYSDILQNRNSTIERNNDRNLSGFIDCNESERLLLTIPYERGWKLYIDGQETAVDKTLGFLMSVQVPEGNHTYEIKYSVPGLTLGIILSILSVIFIVITYFFTCCMDKRKAD